MRFAVLGALEVRADDGRGVRVVGPVRRQLLAALLCRVGQVVSAETLIEDLWESLPPRSAPKTLQSHIVRLRDDLGRGSHSIVTTHQAGYSLDIDRDDFDASLFERMMRTTPQTPAEAVAHLDQALDLWRGDAYVDFGEAAFAVTERLRLSELRSLARERLTDVRLDVGEAGALVPELEAAVRAEPYRERTWEQLILALYRCGRQADALGAYRRVRGLLGADLGVDPGPALQDLEGRVLRQEEGLLGPLTGQGGVSSTSSLYHRCPYLGLSGYRDADAALFVGRERLTAELAAMLADNQIVVVAGPSGSGKSSMLNAGLVPALRSGALPGSAAWRVLVRSPNDLEELPPGTGLVVIDQAEELFTVLSEEERDRVASLLLAQVRSGTQAILALRADFYERLVDLGPLAAITRATLLVRPMRDDEIRRAVVEPAVRCGYSIEPAMVDAVLDEVTGQPAALALMSVSLIRAWENRQDEVLTLDGYRAGGGVAGAIEASAEEVYRSLTEPNQVFVRHLILRLVSLQGSTWVRRPGRLAEIAPGAEAAVLATLADARLVTTTADRVELVHDALLSEWPRLRRWLDERARAAELLEHLTASAQAWLHGGRADADLYRGARLQAILGWRQERPDDVMGIEADFIDASVAQTEVELRQARDRADREAAGRRRLRYAVTALALIALLAVAAGVLAGSERNAARREADRASAAALAADARRLSAQAAVSPDIRTRLLLAVAAYRLQDSADTRSALLSSLEQTRSVRELMPTPIRLSWIGADSDGHTIWAEGNQEILRYSTSTREMVGRFRYSGNHVDAVSPDGSKLLVARQGGSPIRLTVLDARTGETQSTLHDRRFTHVAGFTADSRYLVAALAGGSAQAVAIFDTSRLAARPRTIRLDGAIVAIAVGGSTLAAVTSAGDLSVYDVATGRFVEQRRLPHTIARALSIDNPMVVLSPDGSRIAAALTPGAGVVIADLRHAGQGQAGLIKTGKQWAAIAFSPDGRLLAGGNVQANLGVLDSSTGKAVTTLVGEHAAILGVAWAPPSGPGAGEVLFSGGSDAQIIAWDLGTDPRLLSFHGPSQPTLAGGAYAGALLGIVPVPTYFSGPGRPAQEKLELVDLTHGARATWPLHLRPGDEVLSATTNTDRSAALVSVRGRTTSRCELWDLRHGTLRGTLRLHASGSNGWSAIRPDGTLAAIAVGKRRVGIYRLPDFTRLRTLTVNFRGPNGRRVSVVPQVYGPDGDLLVSGNDPGPRPGAQGSAAAPTDQLLGVVGPATGSVLGQVRLGAEAALNTAAWSPDGSRIIAGTSGGHLWLLRSTDLKVVKGDVPDVSGFVLTVGFSPDGSMIVTGGNDGTLSFFDAGSLQRIGEPLPFPANNWVLAGYGARGVVTGLASAGSIRLQRGFTVPGEAAGWARLACSIADTSLSHLEWSRLVGDRPYLAVCPP
jgi:DNA-binding SARP family transcriptional activator/WD40 repeat protein